MLYPRIAPVRPLPTRLPWNPPVGAAFVAELMLPLVITSRSLVVAANALNETGTLVAFRFHEPPPFPPVAGMDTLAAKLRVRAVKLTLSEALPSAPGVLNWLVGAVAAASV